MRLSSTKTTGLVIDDDIEGVLKLAHKLYFEGSVFIHPTDTIYGFAANPFNKEAVDEISRIKQRDEEHKYILLIQNIDSLLKYITVVDDLHIDFLMRIWPNPVSVVLPVNQEVGDILETETLAFRIPSHTFCQRLLERIQAPLISTSVNRSGEAPLNDPQVIIQEFRDEVGAVFYSQKKQHPVSSTLVDLTGKVPILLREGRIPFSHIQQEFDAAMEKYSGDKHQ